MKSSHAQRSLPSSKLLVAILALSGSVSVYSQTNWTGSTGADWGVDSNWSTSLAPTSADSVVILGPANSAGALNINVAAAAAANAINFTNTAATTLTNATSGANQTLTIGSGGLTTGAGAVTIGSATANQNINVALAANQTWNVGAGGLTVTNVVSGTGFGLIKSGTGVLTLSGANTYSGGTTLNAGTLLVGASSTPTSGTVTSGPLGTGTLTLNGGTFGFATGGVYAIGNNVTVSGATNIQVASGTNNVLNGNWSGSGNLTLVQNGSTGQWTFGGNNGGYTGTFTQNGGNTSLTFNNATAGSAGAAWIFNNSLNQRTRLNFGAGTINFGSLAGNGSIANIAGSGQALVSVGALNTNTTFSGVLGGSTAGQGQNISLVKVGTGTLTLSGVNTYTGSTTVNAGTLALSSGANRLATTSNLIMNGGTFATGGFSQTLGTLTLAGNAAFDFGAGTSALVFSDSSAISWSGTLTLTNFDIGTDTLRFGTSIGALSQAQLNAISLAGYTASLDSSGFVNFSAIPEPSTYAAIFGSLALGGAVLHRRRAKARGL